MTRQTTKGRYVLCVSNRGYSASLDVRKVVRAVDDAEGASHSLVRVIDESGEDYLYPARLFVPIDVPKSASRLFSGAPA